MTDLLAGSNSVEAEPSTPTRNRDLGRRTRGPSVAALSVDARATKRRERGRCDTRRYLLTSAHVVSATKRGSADFVDGREVAFEVVGLGQLCRISP